MTGSRHRPQWHAMLLVLFFGLAAALQAAAPLPASPSPHYIRDDPRWLGPGEFQVLDAKLETFERETSSQFVVAIFQKLPQGEELFDFSQRLYESWKPGGAEKDNGAILLIFADDRLMRIHTGFGMEGALPDARCKQIIQDIIAPRLRQGDRGGAINAGVDAMIAAAKGEYTGSGRTRLDGSEQGDPMDWMPVVLILLFIGFVIFRGISSGAFTLADVIFSVLGASRNSGGGGWEGGSSGGGWSGGGGGGGFSGGGGSSGGGGASGSW